MVETCGWGVSAAHLPGVPTQTFPIFLTWSSGMMSDGSNAPVNLVSNICQANPAMSRVLTVVCRTQDLNGWSYTQIVRQYQPNT